ncbi:MAG: AAA family ATPase, partial [Rubrivivax sp.]
MSSDLVTMREAKSAQIPLARMRNLYSPSDVERRLDKLPQREHETLRATYERMLEKGPERFQVKPS